MSLHKNGNYIYESGDIDTRVASVTTEKPIDNVRIFRVRRNSKRQIISGKLIGYVPGYPPADYCCHCGDSCTGLCDGVY